MKISNLSIDVEQLKGGIVIDPDGVAYRIICFYIDFQGFSNQSEKDLNIFVQVEIEKDNNCLYIEFDTTRTVMSWKSSTEKHGKLKVMSRQMRVVLKKNKKK